MRTSSSSAQAATLRGALASTSSARRFFLPSVRDCGAGGGGRVGPARDGEVEELLAASCIEHLAIGERVNRDVGGLLQEIEVAALDVGEAQEGVDERPPRRAPLDVGERGQDLLAVAASWARARAERPLGRDGIAADVAVVDRRRPTRSSARRRWARPRRTLELARASRRAPQSAGVGVGAREGADGLASDGGRLEQRAEAAPRALIAGVARKGRPVRGGGATDVRDSVALEIPEPPEELHGARLLRGAVGLMLEELGEIAPARLELEQAGERAEVLLVGAEDIARTRCQAAMPSPTSPRLLEVDLGDVDAVLLRLSLVGDLGATIEDLDELLVTPRALEDAGEAIERFAVGRVVAESRAPGGDGARLVLQDVGRDVRDLAEGLAPRGGVGLDLGDRLEHAAALGVHAGDVEERLQLARGRQEALAVVLGEAEDAGEQIDRARRVALLVARDARGRGR